MELKKIQASASLNGSFRSYLRLVELDDADFIFELRSNSTINKFLNSAPADLASQRRWIEAYKERERCNNEYYFIIKSDGKEYGVVRIYDLREGRSSFCWGSWIILPGRPSGLVTFSAIMMYELGFDVLGFSNCHFDVRKENIKVLEFHERAGATRVREDAENVYFIFPYDSYQLLRSVSKPQIDAHRKVLEPS